MFLLVIVISCSRAPEFSESIRNTASRYGDSAFVVGPRQIVVLTRFRSRYILLAQNLCAGGGGRAVVTDIEGVYSYVCTARNFHFMVNLENIKGGYVLVLFTVSEPLNMWHYVPSEPPDAYGYRDKLLSLQSHNAMCKAVPEYSVQMLKRYLEGEVDPEDFVELCREYQEWKRWKIRRHWRWK